MTAASEFYRKHYGGGVPVGATPLDAYAQQMLAPRQRYGLVAEHLANEPPNGGCIAEIGCGGGEALLIFSRQYNFEQFVGVDLAVLGEHERVRFVKANLDESWPLKEGEVDCLIAMMVIEHLYDPFHAFAEIKRVLSPNGTAFVNLPLVTGIKNHFRLLLGRLPNTSVRYDNWVIRREWDGNHLHYFSVQSIRDLATAYQLRVTEIRGVGKLYRLKNWWPELLANEITLSLQHVDSN